MLLATSITSMTSASDRSRLSLLRKDRGGIGLMERQEMHQSNLTLRWRRQNSSLPRLRPKVALQEIAESAATTPRLLNDGDSTTNDALVIRAMSSPALTSSGDIDDDVVVEPYTSSVTSPESSGTLFTNIATPSSVDAAAKSRAHRVGADVVELVTDEFKAVREREVERRRKYLYQLTHPIPTDYTYAGKLLPPPPLAFGQIAEESISLGQQLMLGQHYSKVLSAPSSDYFFEINNLYMEIVMVGRANAGKSSLINSLLGQPEMAKTSSTPNSTREVTFYQSVTPDQLKDFANRNPNKLVKLPGGGLQLTFVDLPGFGIEGMSDAWRDNAIAATDSYLGVRRSVNTVLFCIDCDRGLTKTDITYMEWLENLHGVFFIVLTKCDTVPHSRVCAVMRQVYELITKQRRKFRKAFPFVLPISAKDGTNMDVLRGLIAETSGMIPGDKLRELLMQKTKLAADEAERAEESRLWELWNERRQLSQAQFAKMNPHKHMLLSSGSNDPHNNTQSSSRGQQQQQSKKSVTLQISSSRHSGAGPAGAVARPQRPSFDLPYGGGRVRLHDGVHADEAIDVSFDDAGDGHVENDTSISSAEAKEKIVGTDHSSTTLENASSDDHYVGGGAEGGRVSRYLDTLDAWSSSTSKTQQRQAAKRERLERLGIAKPLPPPAQKNVVVFNNTDEHSYAKQASTTSLVEPHRAAPGWRRRVKNSLKSCQISGAPQSQHRHSNVRHNQSTKSMTTSMESMEREPDEAMNMWRARRYAGIASRENPEAPWNALTSLKKKEDDLRQRSAVSKMSKKDLAAYLKNRGSIINGFEAFENTVGERKYWNEDRQAQTLRSKAQMELVAQDRINFGSQPPGLFKAYGAKDTFKPTSSIIGL